VINQLTGLKKLLFKICWNGYFADWAVKNTWNL